MRDPFRNKQNLIRQSGRWREQFAEPVKNPPTSPKKSEKESYEQRREDSAWAQASVDGVGAPSGADVDSSGIANADAIANRRLVDDILDSAVKESCHLQNPAVVAKPRGKWQAAAFAVLQNQAGCFRRVPQCRGDSVRRYRVDHGCSFACDQPVWSADADMDARAKGSYMGVAQNVRTEKRCESREAHELPAENVLYGKSLLSFDFYRFARCDISNASYAGINGNLPNPVEVLVRCGIHVQRGPLDGVIDREVRPHCDFYGPIVNGAKLELAGEQGCCKARGVDKPG